MHIVNPENEIPVQIWEEFPWKTLPDVPEDPSKWYEAERRKLSMAGILPKGAVWAEMAFREEDIIKINANGITDTNTAAWLELLERYRETKSKGIPEQVIFSNLVLIQRKGLYDKTTSGRFCAFFFLPTGQDYLLVPYSGQQTSEEILCTPFKMDRKSFELMVEANSDGETTDPVYSFKLYLPHSNGGRAKNWSRDYFEI